MAVCPVDGKGCCDDLCHGGGCLRGGGEMWQWCWACKCYHGDDDMDCEIDGDYDYLLDDEDEPGASETESG